MKLAYAISPFFLCCLNSKTINAQSLEKDTSFYAASVSNAIKVYHQFLTPESGLYNGIEYPAYEFPFTEGHQFFEINQLVNGSVEYDGMLYKNVPMQLDLITEHVIINSPEGGYRIQLINERISRFTLLSHTFIRIVKDSANSNVISTGFYDQLYAGDVSILKKERKKIIENTSIISGVTRTVLQDNFYYLEKAGKYYSIKSKSSLMEVLQDKQKEIKQFVRKNKLKFRKNTDDVIVQVARYYDSLKQ
jgi:hypothetical protein